jgi:hypothetical protein
MSSQIWFKDEIRDILLGIEVANAHAALYSGDPEMRAYRVGFRAALAAVAVSFGVRVCQELRTPRTENDSMDLIVIGGRSERPSGS